MTRKGRQGRAIPGSFQFDSTVRSYLLVRLANEGVSAEGADQFVRMCQTIAHEFRALPNTKESKRKLESLAGLFEGACDACDKMVGSEFDEIRKHIGDDDAPQGVTRRRANEGRDARQKAMIGMASLASDLKSLGLAVRRASRTYKADRKILGVSEGAYIAFHILECCGAVGVDPGGRTGIAVEALDEIMRATGVSGSAPSLIEQAKRRRKTGQKSAP